MPVTIDRTTAWAKVKEFLTPKDLLALAWPIFLLWTTQSDQHLLVWFKDDFQIYPSKETSDQSLPLMFRGDTARSVTLLPVHIVNDGKQPIGDQTQLWWVKLTAPNATRIAMIGQPRVEPRGTIVNVAPNGDPQSVRLAIGTFEKRAEIQFTLMLVNLSDYPRLTLQTNLEGLSRDVGWGSPVDRRWPRLATPILIGVFAIVATIRWFELKKWKQLDRLRKPGFVIGQLVALLFLAFVATYFVAKGLAWVFLQLG